MKTKKLDREKTNQCLLRLIDYCKHRQTDDVLSDLASDVGRRLRAKPNCNFGSIHHELVTKSFILGHDSNDLELTNLAYDVIVARMQALADTGHYWPIGSEFNDLNTSLYPDYFPQTDPESEADPEPEPEAQMELVAVDASDSNEARLARAEAQIAQLKADKTQMQAELAKQQAELVALKALVESRIMSNVPVVRHDAEIRTTDKYEPIPDEQYWKAAQNPSPFPDIVSNTMYSTALKKIPQTTRVARSTADVVVAHDTDIERIKFVLEHMPDTAPLFAKACQEITAKQSYVAVKDNALFVITSELQLKSLQRIAGYDSEYCKKNNNSKFWF